MTGSFLFVKPSDQEGKRDAEDSYGSPLYPYDHASWEWLLERALRRTLLPWALTKSHSRVLLYGHEDKYSMHKWGSYGDRYEAGATPDAYQSVGGPGAGEQKTDADLSDSDREAQLPVSWNSDDGLHTSSNTTVVYGIVDLETMVATLPFSLEWLHPDWSSSVLDAWDLTSSTTEKTTGSHPPSPVNLDDWTWETNVNHVPYKIPEVIPFKCLSHMRTDDPLVTVDITNDDKKQITVKSSPTPVSAPRSTDGSIVNYNGTRVRVAPYGAAFKAGWALSEFSIPYRYGLDYRDSKGSTAYYRDGKTDDSDEDNGALGVLVDVPGEDTGAIAVSPPTSDGRMGFTHEVDWDEKPTWWHANSFPKGLDSIISQRLQYQLKALCPVCQPAIPPAIPAFWEKFPDAGTLSWGYTFSRFIDIAFARSYSLPWMRHLALACTPFDMSARLDAMTTTFHSVPKIFAKIRTETTRRGTTISTTTESSSEGPGPSSQYRRDDYEKVTVEGTTSDLAPTDIVLASVSGQGSGVETYNEFRSSENESESKSEKRQYTWEESFGSNADFIVCLRDTKNTKMSTKITTTSSSTSDYGDGDPTVTENETSSGSLPDSYDPDPDDLLFPDWVLPWIKSAELFASIESRLRRNTDADYIESRTITKQDGVTTYTYSGSGYGSRTHEAHRKIISLGKMDMSTGRFPSVNVTAILSGIDPDPTDPTTVNSYKSLDTTMKRTSESDGNYTESWVIDSKDNNRNKRSRSFSYYVVVKWNFDRTDPETLGTDEPLAKLFRKLSAAGENA